MFLHILYSVIHANNTNAVGGLPFKRENNGVLDFMKESPAYIWIGVRNNDLHDIYEKIKSEAFICLS